MNTVKEFFEIIGELAVLGFFVFAFTAAWTAPIWVFALCVIVILKVLGWV